MTKNFTLQIIIKTNEISLIVPKPGEQRISSLIKQINSECKFSKEKITKLYSQKDKQFLIANRIVSSVLKNGDKIICFSDQEYESRLSKEQNNDLPVYQKKTNQNKNKLGKKRKINKKTKKNTESESESESERERESASENGSEIKTDSDSDSVKDRELETDSEQDTDTEESFSDSDYEEDKFSSEGSDENINVKENEKEQESSQQNFVDDFAINEGNSWKEVKTLKKNKPNPNYIQKTIYYWKIQTLTTSN